MDKPNNKTGITYRLQVKDHKLRIDDSNTDNFKDTADFRHCLSNALDWNIGDYELEQLIFGEISNITIVISQDDIGDEDFVSDNAG